MKQRPILFKGEMVRAILSGQKTQTRRPVKKTALLWLDENGFNPQFVALPENHLCPYGQVGDQLWVRETFCWHLGPYGESIDYFYRADHADDRLGPWTPSIHMPREASRITLEITGARVERLKDTTEGDIIKEGCPNEILYGTGWYRSLWESINGSGSWDANPWVWVVEFKMVKS